MQFKFTKKVLWGSVSSVLLVAIAPMTAQAQEVDQEAQVLTASPPASATPVDEIDEIIATGTRSAIANSLGIKRRADSIMDSLSADHADRFPDNNIGEALARIPGISFQRDTILATASLFQFADWMPSITRFCTMD